MAGENTISTLDGLYKTVYGDKLEKVIPEFAKFQAAVPFSAKKKLGRKLEFPVVLALENGVTYGAPEAGPFTLNAALAGQLKPAEVKAYQHVLRSAIAYDAAFQAEGSGPEAFENATQVLFTSMVESIRKRLEVDFLGYGRSGLGKVSATPGGGVITITDATWAPGVWAGLEGAEIEAFDGVTGTDTKHAGAGGGGQYVITKVDFTNKQITVDNIGACAPNDYLYFRSQRTASAWNALVGLEQICTTSGTLFGIVNTSYTLFAGQSYNCGSTDLSVDSITKAIAQAAPRGGTGNWLCWISPRTWANLSLDLAALVKYDNNAGGKYEIGADSIKIRTAGGVVTIEPHEMIKEGEGYIFQPKLLKRSGVTDVTFNRNKMAGQLDVPPTFFRELSDSAGYEVRCYSSQYIVTAKPASFIKLTSIVNS